MAQCPHDDVRVRTSMTRSPDGTRALSLSVDCKACNVAFGLAVRGEREGRRLVLDMVSLDGQPIRCPTCGVILQLDGDMVPERIMAGECGAPHRVLYRSPPAPDGSQPKDVWHELDR